MCSEMLTWLYNSEPSGKPSQSSKTTEPCDFSETSDSSNECGNDSDTVTATVTLHGNPNVSSCFNHISVCFCIYYSKCLSSVLSVKQD